jgi:hypothetical protein
MVLKTKLITALMFLILINQMLIVMVLEMHVIYALIQMGMDMATLVFKQIHALMITAQLPLILTR